jgi:hypothetical protein
MGQRSVAADKFDGHSKHDSSEANEPSDACSRYPSFLGPRSGEAGVDIGGFAIRTDREKAIVGDKQDV